MSVALAICVWLGFAPLPLADAPATQARRRVAVMATPTEAAVVGRLRDELGVLGFEVHRTDLPPTPPSPTEIEALARQLEVAAAIAIYTDEAALTIWVVDRTTNKVVVRRASVPDPAEGDRARVIALRAMELLRASLAELERNPHPHGQTVEPAPPVRAALRPSTPKAAFDLGPAVAGSTSEVGPSIHATVGVRWFAHPRWSLGLRGLAPTVPPRIASDLGSAAITIAIVDLGAHVGLRPVSKIVQPEVATAVGLAIIRTDGVAVPPARGTTDHIVTASLRLQAGLAVAVHPRMRLRIDGSVGVLLPRPSVVFVDREVAVWGQPYGIGSLGVEVLFD